jgi:hypothetical protein
MHANCQWLLGTEAFALPGLISLLFSSIKIQVLGPSGNPTTTLKTWLRLPLLSLCLHLTISIDTYYDCNKEIVHKKEDSLPLQPSPLCTRRLIGAVGGSKFLLL